MEAKIDCVCQNLYEECRNKLKVALEAAFHL